MEAFSDGVMAIIITIMVLEIKMPHGSTLNDLKEILPAFFSYVQSFLFVGVYWNNHHHLIQTVKKVNGRIMVANLMLLFFLSLIPFATNWVGETSFAPVPVSVYAVILMICGVSWNFLQGIIEKTSGWSEPIKKLMDRQARKGWISTVLYASGIGFAFVHPYISELLFISVAIMWLLPDKNIETAFDEVN